MRPRSLVQSFSNRVLVQNINFQVEVFKNAIGGTHFIVFVVLSKSVSGRLNFYRQPIGSLLNSIRSLVLFYRALRFVNIRSRESSTCIPS